MGPSGNPDSPHKFLCNRIGVPAFDIPREPHQRHMYTLADLDRATEHVTGGRRRVDRQRELIAEMNRDGHDTTEAEDLLGQMLAILRHMERHRDEIEVDLTKRGLLS